MAPQDFGLPTNLIRILAANAVGSKLNDTMQANTHDGVEQVANSLEI